MFGSNVLFVFSGHKGASSVWIFGESNDRETDFLWVTSHEDLTNPYRILQCNETREQNYKL